MCLYDGSEMILYWCDAISEVAFVVPSLRQQFTSGSNMGESSSTVDMHVFLEHWCYKRMEILAQRANMSMEYPPASTVIQRKRRQVISVINQQTRRREFRSQKRVVRLPIASLQVFSQGRS